MGKLFYNNWGELRGALTYLVPRGADDRLCCAFRYVSAMCCGLDSEVTLLGPKPRARMASDATDDTVVQYFYGTDQGDEAKHIGDPNKYQRKILESF